MCKFQLSEGPGAAIRYLLSLIAVRPRKAPNGEGYHSAMNGKSIHRRAPLSPGFHPAGEDLPAGAPDCGWDVNQ